MVDERPTAQPDDQAHSGTLVAKLIGAGRQAQRSLTPHAAEARRVATATLRHLSARAGSAGAAAWNRLQEVREEWDRGAKEAEGGAASAESPAPATPATPPATPTSTSPPATPEAETTPSVAVTTDREATPDVDGLADLDATKA